MKYNMSISATKVSAFLNNFETTYNICLEEIFRLAGVDSLILSSPDNRICGAELQKIIEASVRLTRNENLGLQQGNTLSKGFSNILGYVLMNCATLKDCWFKYCKYEKIVDSTSLSHLTIKDNHIAFNNTTLDSILVNNRQFIDFKMSGMFSYMKLLLNKKPQLTEVHFTYSKPKDILEYKRIFQCAVLFEQPMNALIFTNEFLSTPVIEPNENLLIFFEKTAEEMLKSLNNPVLPYTAKVTEILLEDLKACDLPSIETVSKKLLLSVRSLQLYLKKEETSYVELVKEVRKNIAKKYLKDKTISIDEITYLLGFSEKSAFHRAFKSWTGLTPVQFRSSP